MDIQGAIGSAIAGTSLTQVEAADVMRIIMGGEATDAQIAGLLVALRMKGETPQEITGFAQVMRECATRIECSSAPLVDTCGTGGDGLSTFNISTAAAFVAAGAGVRVAKHGNRAASSVCGSADVLEALGVNIEASPSLVARCVDEVGIGFLFARSLHPAMKHAAGPRKELGQRTVFNILGPLSNPAGATRQVLGVFSPDLPALLARVVQGLGVDRAYIVHGLCGMDEISTTGPTRVAEVRGEMVELYDIMPEDLGLARAKVEQLAGGSAAENATILRRVLDGEPGPRRDIVVANAAAAIAAAGLADDLASGIEVAVESIDSGRAVSKLEALREISCHDPQ